MKTLLSLILLLLCGAEAFAQSQADTARLPEVLVTGNFPAYLRALEQQRRADGIVSVLNLDLPGRFPDLNPAEALQRLPGVVLQRSQGEGRFVHIRGADPAFTTVQVDGEQIISPEAGHRFLQFDLLPVDQLRAVEVWKTNRPDQDGDAVGGSINLLTHLPEGDLSNAGKPNWRAAVAGGFNPAAGLPNGQAQLAFSGKHLSLNGSLWQDHRATDNLETVYGIRDNGISKKLFINDLELRHFDVARRRLGLTGAYVLPFKGENGQAYLRGMYVDFEEKNERQRLRYRPGKGVASSGSDTIFNARIGRDVQFVRETERFLALQSGFERNSGRWKTDGAAAWSYGIESEPEGREMDFYLPGVDLLRTNQDAKYPQFSVVNGESADAYNKFVLNELEAENDRSTDQALTARANAQLRLHRENDYLKFGGKARIRHKNSRASESIYDEYTGATPLLLTDLLQPGNAHPFLRNHYTFGRDLDWDKAQSTINAHFTDFQRNEPESALESTAGNFDIRENTAAAYALIRIKRGRWEGLAGARLEHTDYQYKADRVSIDSTGVTRTPSGRVFSGNYNFLLPTLQAKYLAANGLRWQAAFSASYARPSFDQLAPYELFNQLDGEVIAGNPNLRPALAWNLDLAVEKLLSGGGSVSLGLFAKRIEHFIFTQQSRDTRLWGGSQVDVLTTVPLNGETAWLGGAELAWQQQLRFLPGPLSGLGVYANYTYTWSRAFAEEEDAEEGDGFRLPGQATHSGNLALWYDRKHWSGRVALNVQSDFLLQAAEPEDAESQLIYGGSAQLDATVGYTFGKHVTVFGEAMNLLNTPLRYFTGDKEHLSKLEYYGAWGRVGVKAIW